MSDPQWMHEAIRLRDQGRAFLRKGGFGGYEVDQLADATIDYDRPPRVGSPHFNAEIVATAIMVQIAEGVIAAWTLQKTDNVPTAMYLLGGQEKIAESFIKDSGHPVEAALESDGHLDIAASNNEFRRKKGRREFNLLIAHRNHLKKKRPLIDSRDSLICLWGENYKAKGVSNASLTRVITEQFNESLYCKTEFPEPLYPLDRKWVLKILRRGGVLPLPKSRI